MVGGVMADAQAQGGHGNSPPAGSDLHSFFPLLPVEQQQ